MDTSTQATELITVKGQSGTRPKRQYRPIEEKRRIVEETLVEGASVARVALSHGVNANQVFGWRKLYLAGRGQREPCDQAAPKRLQFLSTGQVTLGTSVQLGSNYCRIPGKTVFLSLLRDDPASSALENAA